MSQNNVNKYRELAEQLRDPFRLRMAVCLGALLLGYFSLYAPMESGIEAAQRRLRDLRRHGAVAEDVHLLQQQDQLLSARLGEGDMGACVQHVVSGIRQKSLKVLHLEPVEPQRIGPLQAAVIQLEVEGSVTQFDSLLHWIDTNPLLFRVESFHIAPSRDGDSLPRMQLKLLLLKEQA